MIVFNVINIILDFGRITFHPYYWMWCSYVLLNRCFLLCWKPLFVWSLSFYIYLILYLGCVFIWMYVYVCMQPCKSLPKSEKDVRTGSPGFAGVCEPWCRCWEQNLGTLQGGRCSQCLNYLPALEGFCFVLFFKSCSKYFNVSMYLCGNHGLISLPYTDAVNHMEWPCMLNHLCFSGINTMYFVSFLKKFLLVLFVCFLFLLFG